MKYMLKKNEHIPDAVMNNAGTNVNTSIAEAFYHDKKEMKGRMNYEQNQTGFAHENQKAVAQQLRVIRPLRDSCRHSAERFDHEKRQGQADGRRRRRSRVVVKADGVHKRLDAG